MKMFPMKKLVFALIVSTVAVLLISAPVLAQSETGELDSGDTTWILMCAALVMLMTPAVGLFYGGMVRKKNANSLIIQSFIILSLVSIQWVVLGYTLSFGSDIGGVIGGLEYAGLEGVGSTPNPDYAPTIPHTAFVIFQGMFAIITPVLVIGAFAERIKLSALILFVLLWCILVYDPIAHWVGGRAAGWEISGHWTLPVVPSFTYHREYPRLLQP
jgi:Amt family ammonium transporter